MRADYQSMSLDELLRLYDEATLSYYGDGEAIMSDEDFDELREWLEMFHYENPEVQNVLTVSSRMKHNTLKPYQIKPSCFRYANSKWKSMTQFQN